MAGLFDLTGQNIENTYQRILQTPDGVNVYDGTGSAFTITAVINTSSLVTTSSFNVFTASINNFTSSYNTGSFSGSFTGSLSGTASYYIETDPVFTAVSGTFVTTSSFNNFTSSYNTGSFTGSFSGSFYGTSSWAQSSSQAISSSYAITASYALTTNTAVSSTQASTIVLTVLNQTGAPISKGTVVRITGSNNASDTPRISIADWTNDNLSANTLGLVLTTGGIANGTTGSVLTEGVFLGYDTDTPGWISGQLVFLGANGTITGSAPQAPLHAVRLGQVVRAQSNNGSIYIRVDNGYELDELHDVLITNPINGNLLIRSSSVWINSNRLTGSYDLTGSLNATSFTGSLLGTSSWAYNASQSITSSYILSSNIWNPTYGQFDRTNYAATADIANSVASPLNQDLTINGKIITQLNNSNIIFLTQNLHSYTGCIISGTKDANVNIGDLVYLDTDNNWYQVDQTQQTSIRMLGIWVDDTNNYVLLEGDICLNNTQIESPSYGLPIFISGSAGYTTDSTKFLTGFKRVVGHLYHTENIGIGVDYWLLRFKPSNDWSII